MKSKSELVDMSALTLYGPPKSILPDDGLQQDNASLVSGYNQVIRNPHARVKDVIEANKTYNSEVQIYTYSPLFRDDVSIVDNSNRQRHDIDETKKHRHAKEEDDTYVSWGSETYDEMAEDDAGTLTSFDDLGTSSLDHKARKE
jgi:hypothetical protein